ncbi:hypothetical protein QOT17_010741 [Balamuthia mandrillaris]
MEKWHGKLKVEFKVGDLVLNHSNTTSIGESKKLQHSWKGPHKIIQICSSQTIKVQNIAGPEMDKVVNLNHIKQFILHNDEDRELADEVLYYFPIIPVPISPCCSPTSLITVYFSRMTNVKRVMNVKYLGLWFEECGEWTTHSKERVTKAKQVLYSLR